jgi:hypothetical protein
MNSLNTKIWGDAAWKYLYSIGYSAPKKMTIDQINIYENLFELIGKTLPCENCQDHFNEYIKKNPLVQYLRYNPNKLNEWILGLNNFVNDILDKPIINYNNVCKKYGIPTNKKLSVLKEFKKLRSIRLKTFTTRKRKKIKKTMVAKKTCGCIK